MTNRRSAGGMGMEDPSRPQARTEVLHQLRLSLSILSGYLQLLQREHQRHGFMAPRVATFTDHMLTEAAQLSRLLDRLDERPPEVH